MVADEFLLLVPGPVGFEVGVGADSAQLEHGFGAGEAPAGAGDVQAVFDQVADSEVTTTRGTAPASWVPGARCADASVGSGRGGSVTVANAGRISWSRSIQLSRLRVRSQPPYMRTGLRPICLTLRGTHPHLL